MRKDVCNRDDRTFRGGPRSRWWPFLIGAQPRRLLLGMCFPPMQLHSYHISCLCQKVFHLPNDYTEPVVLGQCGLLCDMEYGRHVDCYFAGLVDKCPLLSVCVCVFLNYFCTSLYELANLSLMFVSFGIRF